MSPIQPLKGTTTHCLHNPRQTQLTLLVIKNELGVEEEWSDTTWGHKMEPIDANCTFRVLFQNPRGLKLTTDPLGTHFGFTCARQME